VRVLCGMNVNLSCNENSKSISPAELMLNAGNQKKKIVIPIQPRVEMMTNIICWFFFLVGCCCTTAFPINIFTDLHSKTGVIVWKPLFKNGLC
jgi:hypothetical protein